MRDEVPERQYDPNFPSYLAPLVGFRSRKAAQLCAFFALKSQGVIEKLKLIKLIYFSERRVLAEHHRPMLFDELFSLPHGPICSSTLNGIDGAIHGQIWDDFVARNGNNIVAMKKFDRNDFDEVSDEELDAVEKIWDELGHMTASQLRNYSHKYCAEYTETTGRIPIAYREVLEALGVPEDEAEIVERDIASVRREESALGL
ncbi:MAG: Panacea domain-containing protein [Alphaproteobacteria bacterium]|nr:Panacea domain-containing protein [Alphaproteobacteria bacterium]